VNQAEADQIVEVIVAKDLPVTHVLFPDEGHGFARPENNLAFNRITEAFLHGCLGGRFQPPGDDLADSSMQVPTSAEHAPGLAEALDGFEPVIRTQSSAGCAKSLLARMITSPPPLVDAFCQL